tara:strand:+ start:630 stop:947 length:318 start_codon:yes stop_codon:yes gene_type:complete
MGKGSKRRPEDYNKVSQEWDRIFGKKKMDIEKLREKLKNHIVCIEFQSLNSGDMKSREYTLCEKYMNIPNHVARQTGDKLLCYDVEFKRWEDIQEDTITKWTVVE